MTLQELTAKMSEGASKKTAFGNTVKFSTDEGNIYIDGMQSPPSVSNDDKAADNEGQKGVATAARVLRHRVSPDEDSLGQSTAAHSRSTCPPGKGSLTSLRRNYPCPAMMQSC